MGLLANDMALKTSGSGSSSKIRADKSEEDDDSPSRRYGSGNAYAWVTAKSFSPDSQNVYKSALYKP